MTSKFVPQKVWCPAVEDMVAVIGKISPLQNGLKELIVKQCIAQETCEKVRRGHHDCLVRKRLEDQW